MGKSSEYIIDDSIWACSFANWKSFKYNFDFITSNNNIASSYTIKGGVHFHHLTQFVCKTNHLQHCFFFKFL